MRTFDEIADEIAGHDTYSLDFRRICWSEYAVHMQTVTTDEAMQKLPDLLRQVKSRAVVIHDGDQPVVR